MRPLILLQLCISRSSQYHCILWDTAPFSSCTCKPNVHGTTNRMAITGARNGWKAATGREEKGTKSVCIPARAGSHSPCQHGCSTWKQTTPCWAASSCGPTLLPANTTFPSPESSRDSSCWKSATEICHCSLQVSLYSDTTLWWMFT